LVAPHSSGFDHVFFDEKLKNALGNQERDSCRLNLLEHCGRSSETLSRAEPI
jgi:hypothetical protein